VVLPLPQSGREGTEELKNTRGSQATGCHTRRTTWGTQEELTVAPMACSCCLVSQVFPTAECLHGNAGQGNVEVDCLNGSMENDVLNEKRNKQTNKRVFVCVTINPSALFLHKQLGWRTWRVISTPSLQNTLTHREHVRAPRANSSV